MLKLFGSPRKAAKDTRQSPVPSLVGCQLYNPYTQVTVLSHHTDIVRHLTLIDKNRLASSGDDTTIAIWVLQTSKRAHVLTEHSRPVTCLYVLPGGATSTTSEYDSPGRATVTSLGDDTPGGATSTTAESDSPGEASSMRSGTMYNGPVLLSAASDKLICMWDPMCGTLLRRLVEHLSTARCFLTVSGCSGFCSGGEKLCFWSLDGDLITVLDRQDEEDISQMIELRDDRLVISVDKRPVVCNIRETDGSTSLLLNRKLAPHREAITSLLKINDACFVSGSLDGTIILWSAQALAPSRYFNSISDYLGDNRVLPYSIQTMICLEERYLVCAIGTGFCIYDIITGRLLAQRRHAHYSKILSLAVVYNGTLLATSSEDGSVRLWGCRKTFTQSPGSEGTGSAIKRLLGIGPKDAKLLKEKDEKIEPQLLGECLGHDGAIRVCVNTACHGMVTCGVDGIIINWKDGLCESMKTNSMLQEFYNNLKSSYS